MRPTKKPTLSRREAIFTLLGTALLPGCGGGLDIASISSGGTGSFTSGTILGLGSVIVNGIRYDDTGASVRLNGATGSTTDLQLGMVVRIQGSAVTAAATTGALATATADQIDCSSEWKGLVSGVDVGGNTFLLLGQTVRVLSTTLFTGGQFNGDFNGQFAEVYGFINPSDASLQATRVEISSTAPSRFRLSGVITHLAGSTMQIGSAVIDLSSASGTSGLQNGMLVRVELQTSTNASGQWIASSVVTNSVSSELQDKDEAEIEGSITHFTSTTSFSVNGIPVDASRITPPAGLALGVRVEVKGSISGTTVVAREIDIEDDDEVEARDYEFHGTVSGLDTGNRRFDVRGYTVRYDGSTTFEPTGTVLTNGLSVEVKATLDASGKLLATKIKVEN